MTVFDVARSLQGGKLDQIQVESLDAILLAWEKYGDGDNRKIAYILATATSISSDGRYQSLQPWSERC